MSVRNHTATGVPIGSRGLLQRIRDARIRTKLGMIMVVPVLAVLVLTGVRLVDGGGQAAAAERIRGLASLAADVSAVAHEIQRERIAAAELLADPAVPPRRYTEQLAASDTKILRYTTARGELGGVPEGLRERLQRLDEQLAGLPALRALVTGRQVGAMPMVVARYGMIVADLVAYREALGEVGGDTALADAVRAAAAFSKAKSLTAEQQVVGYVALRSGKLDDPERASFVTALTGQQESLLAFNLSATPAQRGMVDTTISGDAVALADRLATEVSRATGGTARVAAEDLDRTLGAVNDLMRWAEQRVDSGVITEATALRDTVMRRVVTEGVTVVLTLLLAVGLMLLFASQMTRSLSRLRSGALAVADRELPRAVAQLRDPSTLGSLTPDQVAAAVRDSVTVPTRDEIGEVATSFNIVHREAVRIAAQQARLRAVVSAMFVNLARRSQNLVDRMIAQLDRIERHEADPDRLAHLFALDHLATRMRRNDENLLVLAGADSSPPRLEDAPLADVLRAAQSEVAQYTRVEFGIVDEDLVVVAAAVNEVVRLLAEMLDNATGFSAPETMVVATARRGFGHAVVTIEDRGLGMSPQQLTAVNQRLAEPPADDLEAFRMMGLAVVGKLAARHQIRVGLRPGTAGGTTAEIILPAAVLGTRRPPAAAPLVGSGAAPRPLVGSGAAWRDAGQPRVGPLDGARHAAGPLLADTVTYLPAWPTAEPDPEDTREMPIYRELQSSWFGDEAPPPERPAAAVRPGAMWSTGADAGWRAAAMAAAPPAGGTTPSGLPKRIAQAQLVPGGVDTDLAEGLAVRTPESVRGLLSAYNRGVQHARAQQQGTARPVEERTS